MFVSCHDPTCVYVVYTCRCSKEGTNLVHKYINPVQWDNNLDLWDRRDITNVLKHFISCCFSLPRVVFMNCSRLHRLYA